MPSAPQHDPAAATGPGGDGGLGADLGWTLGVAYRAYVKMAADAAAAVPGSHRGRQVLAAAAHEVPGTQRALAQRLGVDRTAMTYLIDDLAAAGLVERRPDPADRRNRQVVATDAGRRALEGVDRRLRTAEEYLLAGLDTADRTALRTLLRRLAAYIDSADPVGDACQAVDDIEAAESAAMRGQPPAPG
ncbi:MarR family winged helix-turn-helix transcriptional regulator [Nocardiopsis sediminis]|uniref:MarR family winged helix-turn-helix transcriptional regulator n=1 Tax=Nocardiopsis sediminis TaxID=1778267 RepID=A0ABV8FH26_9ACTN